MAARGFIELLRLAERGRQRSRGGRDGLVDRWSGVGFALAGHHFVAPLGEISEVLTVPEYTSVPGVQPWLRGLANVRGRLLPLTDLSLWMAQDQTRPDSRRKVMVIDQAGLFSGLIVDEVFGIQHFINSSYQNQTHQLPTQIMPYTQGCFHRDALNWHIFLPSRLVADSRFLNAATQ
ncbi:MAG: chemotaxis protein CheW [Pseudomonadota bacterium]|nr:chemotaxis protein CheW [Pseudomonadota bacterium]